MEFRGHHTEKGCLLGSPHVWSLVGILLRRAVYLDLNTCGVWWSSYREGLCVWISARVQFGGHFTEKGCLFGSPHVWSLVAILLRRAVYLLGLVGILLRKAVCLALHMCGIW